MSMESYQEMMNDLHDMAFCGGANNSTSTTSGIFDRVVRDNDFQTRALALVRKSIFRLKVDKLPLTLKLSYRQFRELSRDASNAERRRHFSVRIRVERFSEFGITNLDASFVQINVNKIYDIESQNSHLLWILSEISVILARGDWDDCFFWNEEEHQKYLQLLQEAESLV